MAREILRLALAGGRRGSDSAYRGRPPANQVSRVLCDGRTVFISLFAMAAHFLDDPQRPWQNVMSAGGIHALDRWAAGFLGHSVDPPVEPREFSSDSLLYRRQVAPPADGCQHCRSTTGFALPTSRVYGSAQPDTEVAMVPGAAISRHASGPATLRRLCATKRCPGMKPDCTAGMLNLLISCERQWDAGNLTYQQAIRRLDRSPGTPAPNEVRQIGAGADSAIGETSVHTA